MNTPVSANEQERSAKTHGAGGRAEQSGEQMQIASGGLTARLKQLLQAKAAAILDAGVSLLRRLRNRIKPEEEPEEGRRAVRLPPAREHAEGLTPKTNEPSASQEASKPKGRLRFFLICFMVLLLGGLAGMILSYSLFSAMVQNQFSVISRLQDEISSQQHETSQNVKLLAEARNNLEEQRSKRIETEQKLEALLVERAQSYQRSQENRGESSSFGNRQFGGGSSPAKTVECDLDASKPGSGLTSCIDKLNRRSQR